MDVHSVEINPHESQVTIDGYRAAATSKMEDFVLIVNSYRLLTIIKKSFILDVAKTLDLPLVMSLSLEAFVITTIQIGHFTVFSVNFISV